MVTDKAEEKPLDTFTSSKRAHEEENEEPGLRHQQVGGSFKSKLFSMAAPSTWEGFGSKKEKLRIREEDYSFLKGPNGVELSLSEE
ncbi:hypothetical protein ACOSQ4_027499 [Xanthoceras sorbifolium]